VDKGQYPRYWVDKDNIRGTGWITGHIHDTGWIMTLKSLYNLLKRWIQQFKVIK